MVNKNFIKKEILSFSNSLLDNIKNNWILISSGKLEYYNMMTASWVTFGILWNRPIAQIFIRPSRYTLNFLEKNDFFSISFFDNTYKDILSLLGSKSGKNFDKMNIKGLTPIDYNNKTIFFEQAKHVLILKKIYKSKFDENLIPEEYKILFYPNNDDFHFIFYGEIIDYFSKNIV